MNILLFGNANSPLISNLAGQLLQEFPNWRVDIISDVKLYREEYRSNYTRVFELNSDMWYRKIKVLRIIGAAWQIKKLLIKENISKGKYDVVHVLFVNPAYGIVAGLVRTMGRMLCLSVFGSEFYRTGKLEKFLIGRIASQAQGVTAANRITLHDFVSHYKLQNAQEFVQVFGLKQIEAIHKLDGSLRTVSRKLWGIEAEDYVIAIGYNGSPQQNHLFILEQLRSVKLLKNRKCTLVLQMTMGGTRNYIAEVRRKASETGCNVLVITEFVSDDMLAHLRVSVDMILQLQTTDQLSAAMLEYIYTGSVLITGSWLPYEVMKSGEVMYYSVDSISELASFLNSSSAQLELDQKSKGANRKFVEHLCSWEHVRKQWGEIYCNLIKSGTN